MHTNSGVRSQDCAKALANLQKAIAMEAEIVSLDANLEGCADQRTPEDT